MDTLSLPLIKVSSFSPSQVQDNSAGKGTGDNPTYTFHVPQITDTPILQNIWAASQDADDTTFRPRKGWWSLADWATATYLMLENGLPIGVAAIRVTPDRDRVAEARLALLPGHRQSWAVRHLVNAAVTLTVASGAVQIYLYMPESATWASATAKLYGFRPFRALHLMLNPLAAPAWSVPAVEGVRIRPLRPGEEVLALAALNRAWAGTWNFQPLSLDTLTEELAGQREGFLVAVEATAETHIIGTVHAIFDLARRNPDGGPYAWLSNLTTDPAWRGRGLGRTMLAAGVAFLQDRGARSITLGVDGGNPIPMALYRSAGFEPVSTLEVWRAHLVKNWVSQ